MSKSTTKSDWDFTIQSYLLKTLCSSYQPSHTRRTEFHNAQPSTHRPQQDRLLIASTSRTPSERDVMISNEVKSRSIIHPHSSLASSHGSF